MYAGGANPVIPFGGTYDGYKAQQCDRIDGLLRRSRIILSCALWTSGGIAWANGMFRSTDGANWTYMTGSLQNPPAGNDLIGDNGLVYWTPSSGAYAGVAAYWQAKWYNASASANGTNYVDIDRSTDVTLQAGNWATIVSKLIPFSGETAGGYGPNLIVNPSNVLELWTGGGNNQQIYMLSSPDGVTWTDNGIQLTTPFEIVQGFGECRAWYIGTRRYVSAQAATSAETPITISAPCCSITTRHIIRQRLGFLTAILSRIGQRSPGRA